MAAGDKFEQGPDTAANVHYKAFLVVLTRLCVWPSMAPGTVQQPVKSPRSRAAVIVIATALVLEIGKVARSSSRRDLSS